MQRVTRYAKSGDVHIAHQAFGEGPDLIMAPGFVSHTENYWDEPRLARWLNKLGGFCRVVMFDKRGTGLSDHVAQLPHMDERMDDLRAVIDAAGVERASILGISEGGSLAALFAASHPGRSRSLVLYGAFARSCHLGTDQAFDKMIKYMDEAWGSGKSFRAFAPSYDAEFRQWWGKFERLGASPSAAIALIKMYREIDGSHDAGSTQAGDKRHRLSVAHRRVSRCSRIRARICREYFSKGEVLPPRGVGSQTPSS
jgi:pimeloyl-ACP methyl ester carboxylesterase